MSEQLKQAEEKPSRYVFWVAALHKLRVECKAYAYHSRMLREEAKRADFAYYNELIAIRRGRMRTEARMIHLAMGYIRGRTYASMEGSNRLARGKDIPEIWWLRDEIAYFVGDLNAPSDSEVEDWVLEDEEQPNDADSGDRDGDSQREAEVPGQGNNQEGCIIGANQTEEREANPA